MWQKRYQTSCVDKIWSRKNFLTNGNVNHLVQIRSVAIGASTQDSPMTWFDRSRMLSYESANLLKELLRQDDCTRAECVIRNIAYYLQSLEKANYAPNRTISTCEWDRLWYRLASVKDSLEFYSVKYCIASMTHPQGITAVSLCKILTR